MAETDDFKIKGAATGDAQAEAATQPEAKEDGELDPEPEPSPQPSTNAAEQAPQPASEDDQAAQLGKYRWYKIFNEESQTFYFMHIDTQAWLYTEPPEAYWIWDTAKQGADLAAGLQQPSTEQPPAQSAPATSAVEEYKGYNPKIHGSYDPNADYARWHDAQRAREHAEEQASQGIVPAAQQHGEYVISGTFNTRTGRFQSAEQSADRHSAFQKAGRQMDAYGSNIDAAANSHGGVSLKDERRKQKLSKKELAAIREKNKEKKRKKRMDFYTS